MKSIPKKGKNKKNKRKNKLKKKSYISVIEMKKAQSFH